MKTILDEADRNQVNERFRRLAPDADRRWGTMTGPRMVAHLTDQMTHTLGLAEAEQYYGWRRNTLVRYLAIYVLPWPRGKIKGPKDAFVTQPGEWERDIDRLIGYVEEFASRDSQTEWPPHAILGPMTRKDWGAFCYKHFDHHLRQFGV